MSASKSSTWENLIVMFAYLFSFLVVSSLVGWVERSGTQHLLIFNHLDVGLRFTPPNLRDYATKQLLIVNC